MDRLKLSILVPVYNQERYVKKTIESICAQKIECEYEVLIGEDCSSDNSRHILKELQSIVDFHFVFLYRQTNLGMYYNVSDLISRARGEYLTILEGDDFWTDDSKVQRQINYLENHKEIAGCAHKVCVIDEDSEPLNISYKDECNDVFYDLYSFREGKLPGQTSSFLYRNYFLNNNVLSYMKDCDKYPLDRFIAFVVATNGRIYCSEEVSSAYRLVTIGGSSYTASGVSYSSEYGEWAYIFRKALCTYSDTINNELAKTISEQLFFRSYMRKFKDNKNLFYILQGIRNLRHPISTVLWLAKQIIKVII